MTGADGTTPSPDELDRLAAEAAAGSAASLERFLELARPVLLARCRKVLPDPGDAEDACQEAMLVVARRIGSFEHRSRVSTWLYRIAVNAAIDTYRRLRSRAAVLDPGDLFAEAASRGRTSVLAGNRIDLVEAFDHVDPHFTEPVALRDLVGLDYDEIADALGVPVGTVKSRIHEGRARLRTRLAR